MSIFNKIPAMGRAIGAYQSYRKGCHDAREFSLNFVPRLAVSASEKEKVFGIRHQVYCDELALEPPHASGMEVDQYDRYAYHGTVHCHALDAAVGTVRVIAPQHTEDKLPIEEYCLHSITDHVHSPRNYHRSEICEISRLAVPRQYRKSPTRVRVDNPQAACPEFAMVAVGLYFTATAVAHFAGKKHAYVMMEPRLARRMGMVGVSFQQIGPVVNYHGRRAPFYTNYHQIVSKMKPAFRRMFNDIAASIQQDMRHGVHEGLGDAGLRHPTPAGISQT